MTNARDVPAMKDLERLAVSENAEVLYEGACTRVVRVRVPGRDRALIRKEMLGPDADRRARHELVILQRLSGLEGVPAPASDGCAGNAILLEDDGGAAAPDAAPPWAYSPLEAGELVRLGCGLARVLVGVHGRGVVHKDVNPANVVVGSGGSPVLIDFDLATTFAEERPDFVHENEIVGTLAFMAPEQTGRTGRPVDGRADLYGLGATLYALGTGRAPFGDGDPLRLVHDHLARVPVPAVEVNALVPPVLSEIVSRLLEKEPDRRYQSASGLLFDLERLAAAMENDPVRGRRARFELGTRDFPARLVPPSRLVGREVEVATLRAALDEAIAGRGGTLLVTGPSGVGKSALVDELRPMVTAAGGWFVAGKSDQFRADTTTDAVKIAMDALMGLLLSEPEDVLARIREDMLREVGDNTDLLVQATPGYGALMGRNGAAFEPADLNSLQARLVEAGAAALRAVVSPGRPLVMVIDDLQWATSGALRFFDAMLTSERIPGLLLIGAHRDVSQEPAHPLGASLARWARLGALPPVITLENLPPADLGTLLADMLRLPQQDAGRLAGIIGDRTGGNPYDTVELINALRRDDVLRLDEHGWSWDAAAIERYVGDTEVADLLALRIDRLPLPSRDLMAVMACLGGDMRFDVLKAATGLSRSALAERTAPPLEDGLLVMSEADASATRGVVRFRHDRVQQAAYHRLDPIMRRRLQLTLGRRLERRPELRQLAAEQYLAAAPMLGRPDECRAVAALLGEAAGHVQRMSLDMARRLLSTALELLDRPPVAETAAGDDTLSDRDQRLRRELAVQLHAVLCAMGRHDEADTVFEDIERWTTDPIELVDPTCVQVSSLSDRIRQRDAVRLGLGLLDRLGLAEPADVGAVAASGPDIVRAWTRRPAEQGGERSDLRRPEITDPRVRALAKLLTKVAVPAFFSDPVIDIWLLVESLRLWDEQGPCEDLLTNASTAIPIMITHVQDFRTAYDLGRKVLGIGEVRGFDTAWARMEFGAFAQHWFEPLEEVIGQLQLSREALAMAGDLQGVAFTYSSALRALLDCGPTLDDYAAQTETALAYAVRIGNEHTLSAWIVHRLLVRCLRGQTEPAGTFGDPENGFDEDAYTRRHRADPLVMGSYHGNRALAAVLLGDLDAMERHSAAAMAVQPFHAAFPTSTMIHLLRALSLAWRFGAAEARERAAIAAGFGECRAWLAARADDCPYNFRHLVTWVDAEWAWARGDLVAAEYGLDAALHAVVRRPRPWQQALITERAGRLALEQGRRYAAEALLAEARDAYAAWGATAKVALLDTEFPGTADHGALRGRAEPAVPGPGLEQRAFTGGGGHRTGPGLTSSGRNGPGRDGLAAVESIRSNFSSAAIDLLGILSASQTLSSETNVDRLHARVVEVLGALTGATSVRLLLRNRELDAWFLPAGDPVAVGRGPADEPAQALLDLESAAAAGLVPVSVVRFVERTGQPLLVEDTLDDDRFAGDPYFADADQCSLLAMPIASQGVLKAILLLENRLARGAFGADRSDSVTLIAGQLAVSLENALMYESLEQKVEARTEELREANEQLQLLTVTDPLTGLANRRRLAKVLAGEWRRAIEPGWPVAVAMVDIDRFKDYNDRYGHLAGDTCLRRVAQKLHETVREVDLVARYGGEEFAVVLPGLGAQAAYAMGEKLRRAVEALGEQHAGLPGGVLTVSIGVAADVPSVRRYSRQLIDSADVQLYRAKRAGRNQVMVREDHGDTG